MRTEFGRVRDVFFAVLLPVLSERILQCAAQLPDPVWILGKFARVSRDKREVLAMLTFPWLPAQSRPRALATPLGDAFHARCAHAAVLVQNEIEPARTQLSSR
jgi:hypothetical protein